jgi:hypothetical protein
MMRVGPAAILESIAKPLYQARAEMLRVSILDNVTIMVDDKGGDAPELHQRVRQLGSAPTTSRGPRHDCSRGRRVPDQSECFANSRHGSHNSEPPIVQKPGQSRRLGFVGTNQQHRLDRHSAPPFRPWSPHAIRSGARRPTGASHPQTPASLRTGLPVRCDRVDRQGAVQLVDVARATIVGRWRARSNTAHCTNVLMAPRFRRNR